MKKVIVHGVHRSGTSLTASLLERAGYWYAENEFRMPAQPDNPKGFWERLDVVELNDAMLASQNMGWFTLAPEFADSICDELVASYGGEIERVLARLDSHADWFLKDPRLSITWPVWKNFLQATHHIAVHRHPVAVAKSLQRRNGISIKHGLIFWYHQTRMLAAALQDEKNVFNIIFSGDGQSENHALDIINVIGKTGEGPRQQAKNLESMFDAALINHKEIDDSIAAAYPQILKAWEHASRGEFAQLLKLPEVRLAELDWIDLDSRYALASIKQKSDRDLNYQQTEIENQQRKNEHLQTEIENQQLENEKLQRENEKRRRENENLRQDIQSLDKEIRSHEEQLAEIKLSALKTATEIKRYMLSTPYLFSSGIGKMLGKLRVAKYHSLHSAFDIAKYGHSADELERALPKASNRHMLLSAIVKQPSAFIRRITLKRVLKGLQTLLGKGEEDIGVQQALVQYQNVDLPLGFGLKVFDPKESKDWQQRHIEFQLAERPEVSIVIPVYNNYLTTLACLHSILEFTDFNEINYQVVIADDCSSDETREIEKIVVGLKIVRGVSNQGFLQNCNKALSQIDSPYVVLLNNDTNVQKNWLPELLDPLKQDPAIGVTGPMFIYPDGRLQEAGGIIFSDASGWNYGRFDQPAKPQYGFARDVDYVSGACLVFRKSLWDQIGGFDEQFAPAYYEDTDFCFATRKLGQRVRYVPTAKVIHFEGVSHGSNEDSGIKKYQVVNRDKFAAKWREVLEREHFAGPEYLFSARIHGKARKTLLFIDHYVPFYDKDAGSKVAQRYIQLLLEQGVHVIFLGENFYPHQPYTAELEALGVEVLYGEYYKNHWFEWLQTNVSGIDAIYLNRPHIAEIFIDKILSLKEVPHIAYHGADLHYLRVQREQQLGIETNGGRSAEQWKTLEFDLMRKCDVSLWLSETEIERVGAEDPSINVAYMPMYWFDESDFSEQVTVTDEPNLVFVGSFVHPPNRDGLEWFLDKVFPEVVKRFPQVKLSIIGSNCPDDIKLLQSENIDVLGFVSEQQLEEAYRQARISVVPLRYGAGVKGKVIESMQHGVTVLTTNVGVEGLPAGTSDYLSVCDSQEDYTAALVQLLEDDALCEKKANMAQRVLVDYYSHVAALKAMNTILGISANRV